MSPITCNVSNDFFHKKIFSKNNDEKKYLYFYFLLMGQIGWASWLRVCYHCGLTRLAFSEVLCQHGMISWLFMYHQMIDQIHTWERVTIKNKLHQFSQTLYLKEIKKKIVSYVLFLTQAIFLATKFYPKICKNKIFKEKLGYNKNILNKQFYYCN